MTQSLFLQQMNGPVQSMQRESTLITINLNIAAGLHILAVYLQRPLLQPHMAKERSWIYIHVLINFHVSERLHRGPEFYHNHLELINYLIDYTIGFIIITP